MYGAKRDTKDVIVAVWYFFHWSLLSISQKYFFLVMGRVMWASERARAWWGARKLFYKVCPWGLSPFDHHKTYEVGRCSFIGLNNHTVACPGLWYQSMKVRDYQAAIHPYSFSFACWHIAWHWLALFLLPCLAFRDIRWISLYLMVFPWLKL